MTLPFLYDPTFNGTFYSGAGYIAGINVYPECCYYTNINQNNKTLEL
jgi:hypothetical protein